MTTPTFDFHQKVKHFLSNKRDEESKHLNEKILLSSSIQDIDNDEANSLNSTEYGLTITLEGGDSTKTCRMTFGRDENLTELHPNIYAPACLTNLKKLGGGGSGVTVFSGTHPNLGDLVMKHGSYKDTKEAFALATITEQLHIRGVSNHDAMIDMQKRIPEFSCLYISPKHLRATSSELWHMLKTNLFLLRPADSDDSSPDSSPDSSLHSGMGLTTNNNSPQKNHFVSDGKGRSITLTAVENQPSLCSLRTRYDTLDILLDSERVMHYDTEEKSLLLGLNGDGFQCLQSLVENLIPLQKQHLWKFTQAQKAIGGEAPRTGSSLLTEGKLNGPLLDNLIDQFIRVLQNLRSLTLPEEVDIIDHVREELAAMDQSDAEGGLDSSKLSKQADIFFGNAFKKNWHPELGRFVRLRDFGKRFRSPESVDLFITKDETIPIRHLGNLLIRGSKMGETFVDAPMEHVIINGPHEILRVFELAINDVKSPAALERIWTCGLADAGLHNLFLSMDNLWLFDLGEPQLQSLPGFLTKFLFSFFHTLGMEENGLDSWVKRFVPQGNKLALTNETAEMLPKAYDAFETTLERLIVEIFDGDDSVRPVLIQYIELQLLSDASFCLERWSIKGGGRPRDSNHQKGIEKWLWRALWDLYVAFDIKTYKSCQRLKVPPAIM